MSEWNSAEKAADAARPVPTEKTPVGRRRDHRFRKAVVSHHPTRLVSLVLREEPPVSLLVAGSPA